MYSYMLNSMQFIKLKLLTWVLEDDPSVFPHSIDKESTKSQNVLYQCLQV